MCAARDQKERCPQSGTRLRRAPSTLPLVPWDGSLRPTRHWNGNQTWKRAGLPAGRRSDICGQSGASSVPGPAHAWLHAKKSNPLLWPLVCHIHQACFGTLWVSAGHNGWGEWPGALSSSPSSGGKQQHWAHRPLFFPQASVRGNSSPNALWLCAPVKSCCLAGS